MNATASAITRIAGIALVLILAAILGLVAGNVLNARGAGSPAGAGLPDTVYANVWGNVADDVASAGAPAYADPYRAHMQAAAQADAAIDSLQTWGNVDERHDAPAQPANGSATAPTLR